METVAVTHSEKQSIAIFLGALWNCQNCLLNNLWTFVVSIWAKELQKQPPQAVYEKGVLRHFEKFTGKHLWRNLFFDKVADRPEPATLLKKETLAQVFPCDFYEISVNTFLQKISGRLLLELKTFKDFWHSSILIWTIKVKLS